jgi:hypothetical protein
MINLRAKCLYDGVYFEKCPNNENGLCRTIYSTIESFMLLFHDFDGKNYIKCLCG